MTEHAFEGGGLADQTDINLGQGFRELDLDHPWGLFFHTTEWLGLARADATVIA
jgi:hypothetical protein